MNTPQAACNYAMLRFLPYPETGEFVNVGVVVNCLQPCLLHFLMEEKITERIKALFPDQNEAVFESAAMAMHKEMQRVKDMIRNAKTCQFAFNEAVRPRESTFRFSETRTILTQAPKNLAEDLFRRYVRMKAPVSSDPQLAIA